MRRCSVKNSDLKNFDLNNVVCLFIKKETLAQVFSCEFCEFLRTCFSESAKLHALRANVPRCFMCSRALRAYVLTCLRAYILTCQRALRAYVFTYQRALGLRAHVATCLSCLRAHVPCVAKCSRAVTSNNKNKVSVTCLT